MPYPVEKEAGIAWLHVITAAVLGFIALMASTDCRPLVPVVEFILEMKA